MNLRLRLNLMIAGALALTLLLGVTLVIRNAQQAVDKELRSAAELTSQLLQAALSGPDLSTSTARYRHLFEHIAALKTTRHLDLELRTSDGIVRVKQGPPENPERPDAPDWFVRLVAPSPMELAHSFTLADNEVGRIALRADPADEITEAWKEARDMLAVLLVFYVAANALVFFTIGRGLQPIGTILAALDGVERGDYRQRLPLFALPELSRISKHFNRMTERLEQGEEQTRLLTQRSLAIQEEERRSLARELHDELGQCLSAIKADAVSIGRLTAERCPDAHEHAQAITAVANHVYGVIRSMMRRLRPAMLDELGLETTLRETLKDWNARHPEVACRFSADGPFDDLSGDAQITLYRVLQECLTNISRHAHARTVSVTLTRGMEYEAGGEGEGGPAHEQVRLHVKDDGRGFDVNAPTTGFGLLGMAERVRALAGSFQLSTGPGAGVEVQVRLPCEIRRMASEHAGADN
ncbi:MAG: histidine kinase [Gammaproteobacteria bacterium]